MKRISQGHEGNATDITNVSLNFPPRVAGRSRLFFPAVVEVGLVKSEREAVPGVAFWAMAGPFLRRGLAFLANHFQQGFLRQTESRL